MKTFKDIIELWEKRKSFASAINISPGLASLWWQRDSIDAKYYNAIVEGARKIGHPEVTHEMLCNIAASKRSGKMGEISHV
jgi:hypothetical protein